MDHYRISYKNKAVTYYYLTAHTVHSSVDCMFSAPSQSVYIQYKLVELTNLYEIFKDKIFMGASKTTKILFPKSFRLYGR